MTNFTDSWRDGLAFCAILDRHRPDLLDYEDCSPDTPLENLEKAFKVAEEELGIIRIVDPEDVCVPKPDDKAIMTYVSFLHQAFPDMPPRRKRKVWSLSVCLSHTHTRSSLPSLLSLPSSPPPPSFLLPSLFSQGPEVTPEEYSDLYDDLKAWVDSTTEKAKSRDFPTSVEQLKKEVEKVSQLKAKDIPARKKDLASLSDMHDKLEAFKKKRPSSPGVPEDRSLPQLQTVSPHFWCSVMSVCLFPLLCLSVCLSISIV